jgi:tRNA A-37 threonylcarbamoyl transferase component Bud32/tetratricopeptide (TPR) repeat protein
MSFSIGENVGPYRITAQLGSGGMATVYKAYHASLDRYVAIKVMHAAFREDRSFLSRFQREARIVAKLEHLHIVPVYDFSEHEGQPYLVMRFIEGETLKARLQTGQLTIPQAMDILRPVCQALAYAHDQGVLHRDIKPSNIMLTAQGGVFLTDFGLARIAQAGESTMSQDTMLGTPQYISPEQAQGNANLDARTDIYSLGVVMYELLVGRVPFQADTPYAIIHDHIYSPLPMPRCLNPALPDSFERVLLKALAKERDDRYTAVDELLAALERAVSEVASASTLQVKPPPCEEPASPPPLPPVVAPQPFPAARVAAPAAARVAAPAAAQTVVASSTPPAKKSNRTGWIVVGVIVLALLCVGGLAIANGIRQRAAQAGAARGGGQAEAHLERARQLRDTGKVDQAVAEYQNVVKADPNIIEAYAEPAEMLLARSQPGDPLRAAEWCEQGLKVMNDNERLRTVAAQGWLVAKAYERAMPHLQWWLDHCPNCPFPHAGIAMVLAQQNQLDEALRQAEQAVKLSVDAPEGHLALGLVLMKRGQPLQAREQFRFVQDSPAAPRWMKDLIPK